LRKPAVLVTNHQKVLEHPVVSSCAGWLLPTLDDAVELITGILGDYAQISMRRE
jgi:hypothetical protein